MVSGPLKENWNLRTSHKAAEAHSAPITVSALVTSILRNTVPIWSLILSDLSWSQLWLRISEEGNCQGLQLLRSYFLEPKEKMFEIALVLENLGLYTYREYQVLATEGRENGDTLCLRMEHGGRGGSGTKEKHLPISEER